MAHASWLWNVPGGDPKNQYGRHGHIPNALPQLYILTETADTSGIVHIVNTLDLPIPSSKP